jgi:hypothetical protein
MALIKKKALAVLTCQQTNRSLHYMSHFFAGKYFYFRSVKPEPRQLNLLTHSPSNQKPCPSTSTFDLEKPKAMLADTSTLNLPILVL